MKGTLKEILPKGEKKKRDSDQGIKEKETFFENPRERKREKRSKIKWFLKEKERRVLT